MTKQQFRQPVSSHKGSCHYSGSERTFYVSPDEIIQTIKDKIRHKSRWFVKPAH